MGKFCTVKGQPRSLVFHYWDLYVVNAYGDKIYRYNGYTGSPRGVYLEGGGLDHPWGLIFDKYTNDTYVTSEYKDHIFRYKQPTWGLYGGYGAPSTNGGIHVTGSYDPATQTTNPQGMGISNGLGEEITHNSQQLKLGVNVWKGRFDKVWTNTRVNYANGLDFTVDSMYVTGPYSGKAIVRFNRTTGEYMHHFEDEYLNYPVDIKEFRDYLYVCSEDQVRKYNRLNGEFIKTPPRPMAFWGPSCCSTLTGTKILASKCSARRVAPASVRKLRKKIFNPTCSEQQPRRKHRGCKVAMYAAASNALRMLSGPRCIRAL